MFRLVNLQETKAASADEWRGEVKRRVNMELHGLFQLLDI